jgi:hypothetical protein
MDDTHLARLYVNIAWAVVVGVVVLLALCIPRATWRRHAGTAVFAGAILLVPFIVLSARYGPVSCASLAAEHGCVCFEYKAHAATTEADKQAFFAKADDLCPGHASYRTGAGR